MILNAGYKYVNPKGGTYYCNSFAETIHGLRSNEGYSKFNNERTNDLFLTFNGFYYSLFENEAAFIINNDDRKIYINKNIKPSFKGYRVLRIIVKQLKELYNFEEIKVEESYILNSKKHLGLEPFHYSTEYQHSLIKKTIRFSELNDYYDKIKENINF